MMSENRQFRSNKAFIRCDSFTMSLDQLLNPAEQCHQPNETNIEQEQQYSNYYQPQTDSNSEVGSLQSSTTETSQTLKAIDREIATFVHNLEQKSGKISEKKNGKGQKRPYFRKSKYPKEIVEQFEARKKIQKRERNRVLAAESRRRQKDKLFDLEKENKNLLSKIDHLSKRLRLYEEERTNWC